MKRFILKFLFFLFFLQGFVLLNLDKSFLYIYALDNDGSAAANLLSSYELDNSDIENLNRNFIEIKYALKDKDYQKAIRLLKESEMIDPSNHNITQTLTVALSNYAVYLSSINDFENALNNIEQAYAVSTSNEVEKIYKTILKKYTVNLLKNRKWDSALGNLYYLYTFDRSDDTIIDKISEIYVRWGLELLNKNETEQAQDKFLKSLEYDRYQKDALFYLGYLSYDMQALREAKYYWSILSQKQPDYMNVSKFLEKLERELSVEKNFQYKSEDHFDLRYGENISKKTVKEINNVLNEAYNKLGTEFSCYPDKKITVFLMDRKDFFLDTNLPHWIGGLYDGKMRIPVPDEQMDSEIQKIFKQIIFHEYTHVLIHKLTGNNIPLWLDEGLAERFSGKKSNYKLLKENILNNSYIRFMKLNHAIANKYDPAQMRLAYESSMNIVDFIFYRYGMRKIKKMIFLFGEGKIQKEVLELCFGLSDKEFEQKWKKYFCEKLLSFTERKRLRAYDKKINVH